MQRVDVPPPGFPIGGGNTSMMHRLDAATGVTSEAADTPSPTCEPSVTAWGNEVGSFRSV